MSLTGLACTACPFNVGHNIHSNINPSSVSITHYDADWKLLSACNSLTLTQLNTDDSHTRGVGFFRWLAGASARTYANYALYVSDSGKNANSILTNVPWKASPRLPADFLLNPNTSLCGHGAWLFAGMLGYDGIGLGYTVEFGPYRGVICQGPGRGRG